MPRGNYGGEKKGHGGESKGYGGSKSYGDDDEDVKEVKDSEWSYVGKPSYGIRLYGGKSNGDNEEYIKLVRIVKNIVIEKMPVKSYGYGSHMGSYGQNRYGREQESNTFFNVYPLNYLKKVWI